MDNSEVLSKAIFVVPLERCGDFSAVLMPNCPPVRLYMPSMDPRFACPFMFVTVLVQFFVVVNKRLLNH